MKIGFLADAHGNYHGLELCLDALRHLGVQRVFFLGDAVGYLPYGGSVLQKLRRTGITCVKGNHEAMMIGKLPIPRDKERIYQIAEIRKKLTEAQVERIDRTWEESARVVLSGRKMLLLHGRPADPLNGYLYENDDPLEGEMEGFDLIAMGHTHRPYVRSYNKSLLVNVGSCGLPRDVGNLACCACYDTREHKAYIVRIPMDIKKIFPKAFSGFVAPEVIRCLRRRTIGENYGEWEGGRS